MVNQGLKNVQNWAVSGRFDRIDCTSGVFTTMQDITATSGVFTRSDVTSAYITNATVTSGTITQASTTKQLLDAGSPFTGQGLVIRKFAAEGIISGGMWVIASGTGPVIVPAATSTRMPLGVCLSNTASGAIPDVLVNGMYYFLANGNINAGEPIGIGGGAALNGAITDTVGSATRGTALTAASSGTTAKVLAYLW